MAEFEYLLEEVEKLCEGVNRYNPNNLEVLEDCLNAQIKEHQYDLEGNLTILKLYQLNPDRYNASIVAKILLKCLMALPRSDIVLAKSLIDQSHMDEDPIKLILELADLLEVCHFKLVWELLTVHKELIEDMDGFEESIRNFICHVIDITYQNVRFDTLKELFGNISDGEIKDYCKSRKWEIKSDGYVFVNNHESTVKDRNIEEKIEFSNIKDIIRAAT